MRNLIVQQPAHLGLQPQQVLFDHAPNALIGAAASSACHRNARRLAPSHGDDARVLLGNIAFLELTPAHLTRALDPWPTPLRTLDALHLASLEFLRAGQAVELASYDRRMIVAAQALKIPLAKL